MSRAEIDAVKRRSKGGGGGPWTTDYVAMALKSVVRRLFKWLPVSIELARAVGLDEAAELGVRQESELDIPEGEPTVKTQVTVIESSPAVDDEVTVNEEQLGLLSKAASIRLSQAGQETFLSRLGVEDLADLRADRFDEAMKMLGDKATVDALNGDAAA